MQEKQHVFESGMMRELKYNEMSAKQRKIVDILQDACGAEPERRYFFNSAVGDNGLQIVVYGVLSTSDFRGILEPLGYYDSFYLSSFTVDGYPAFVMELAEQ